MKKNQKSIIASLLCVATVLTAGFANVEATDQSPSEGGTVTTQIVIDGLLNEFGETQTTRALEEGDDWAINLIDVTEKDGALPGGYQLLETNIQTQGKLYMNEGSKIVISAQNYKEDMQDLDIWADNACAMIKIKNITAACDTVFGEPQKTKICGYDAIMYDYDIIQYKFIDNTTKEVFDTYKGRNYYFYSDKNAYVLMFDTNDETWSSEVKNFEKFIDNLVVDGIANESDSSSNVVVICVAAAAIVVAAVAAGIVVGKKKKKAE